MEILGGRREGDENVKYTRDEVLTMFIGDEKNKNKNRSNREGTN